MPPITSRGFGRLFAAALLAPLGATAAAPFFAGPEYVDQTSGYAVPVGAFGPNIGFVAGDGIAVGFLQKWDGGNGVGPRALSWGTAGVVELPILGTESSGFAQSNAYGINAAGTVVGAVSSYAAGNSGQRGARWEPGSALPTLLNPINLSFSGGSQSEAFAINAGGAAAGYSNLYAADGIASLGTRAVRWEAGSTTPVELGHIGLQSSQRTFASALAINAAGTAVGQANKYNEAGTAQIGTRAVRWDAGQTAATELASLGTTTGSNGTGSSNAQAWDINDAGVAIGFSAKYPAGGGTTLGNRAVRWDPGSSAAAELGTLGSSSAGFGTGAAHDINNAGTIVGYSVLYNAALQARGNRAVRWDAGSTAATALGTLGVHSSGNANAMAYALNESGLIVGYSIKYENDVALGKRAVAWGLLPGDEALDLNTLLEPSLAALWTLTDAYTVSDGNWIAGVGLFDPDGADGPLAAYSRAFLMAVPEPSPLALLACGAALLLLRRRLQA